MSVPNAENILAPYYLPESHEGHAVLDAKRLYAERGALASHFVAAVRIEPVYVWRPNAGDEIAMSSGVHVTAQGGETVFIKKLDAQGKNLKVYIPSGSTGPLDESTLDEKYHAGVAYVPKDTESDAILSKLPEGAHVTCRLPKRSPIPILHEVIDRPSVILHARGEGKHQLLEVGDSLKFEDGDCLPLPKTELDSAWQVQERGVKAKG